MSSLEAMEGAKTLGEVPRISLPRIMGLRHSGIYWAHEEFSCPSQLQGAMHLRPASMPWCPTKRGYSQGLSSALLSQVPLEPDQLGPVGILLPD